jgi:hypothetical protein
MDFAAAMVKRIPLPARQKERILEISRRLDVCSRALATNQPGTVLRGQWTPTTIRARLEAARLRADSLRRTMVALQEELDWTVYVAFGLVSESELVDLSELEPIASEHRPFAIRLARAQAAGSATMHWFDAQSVIPCVEIPDTYRCDTRDRIKKRMTLAFEISDVGLVETPECKRKWEPANWASSLREEAFLWLAERVEQAAAGRPKPSTLANLVAAVQDDLPFLAILNLYEERIDVDVGGVVAAILAVESVPSHRFHTYTDSGLTKRRAWEDVWAFQRREDAGERVGTIPAPPDYSQGSRGKSTDFLRNEYWQLRGKLDVPRERFVAFTEVPGRTRAETLYGWAGWPPAQRLKAILTIDEDLEDSGIPLADRVGLLDSAWRLLPDLAREDPATATRLKAELQALLGPEGPSRELIEAWKKRFPPLTARATRAKRAIAVRGEDDSEDEETDES